MGFKKRIARLALAASAVAMAVAPASAQSILRDAETEALFSELSAPLISAAGLQPKNVQIVLINDNSINAFVATGQVVYLHTGLLASSQNANELQGVIAHELGHMAGGHAIRFNEGTKVATGISLLTLVAGIAAAALGAADAGMAIISAGQQAALGKFLAFSREQESRADQAGANYLTKSGISGKGSIAFFKRLQNLEFRYAVPQNNGYGRTHPLNGERISALLGRYELDPAWAKPTDVILESKFQRVKAKLKGFVEKPARTLIEYPTSNTSVAARYARAYAWHKSAYPDKAIAEADGLLALMPNDPYFLELKGQILLESGKPTEALPVLREAFRLTNSQPLIAVLFGHALIATEDEANLKEAERVLKAAVNRENENVFAWYQLGIVYEQLGDKPRAALAAAERFNMIGQARLALANAETAMSSLPKGSADWIRAQDVAMVARDQAERDKKKRK